MPYPTLEQYNLAFQLHSKLLADPELKSGTLAKSGLGLPLAISGGFALTYTVQSGSKKYAVRCFHRESKALERRYSAISQRLNGLRSPYFVAFEFQPHGIKVDGASYPIVKMAWADGETLGEFLEANHRNASALTKLSDALSAMAVYLEGQGIAHGDLQPGNIMVSRGGSTVQLIDYDGMFVSGIRDLGSAELGHVNFQHPQRKATNPFDANLDRFSFISLGLALKALRTDPSVWQKTNSEVDAIVFRATDFADPGSSAAFALLSANAAVSAEAKNFAAVCKSPMADAPDAGDFFAGRKIPPVSIVLKGAPTRSAEQAGYIGAYAVLSALDYAACLRSVGDKVEVIGQIVEVKEDQTKGRKPYIFINFGPWRGRIFKISLWSEGLAVVKPKPTASWVGQWVSVVGLMEPPYLNNRFKYSHLAITVATANQLSRISEAEAKRRLAGGSQVAFQAAPNDGLIDRMKGRAPTPTYSATPSVGTPPRSGPSSRVASPNEAVLATLRGTSAPAGNARAPAGRSSSQAPHYSPPPVTPSSTKSAAGWGWAVLGLIAVVAIALSNSNRSGSGGTATGGQSAPSGSAPSVKLPSSPPVPLAASQPSDEVAPTLRQSGRLTMPQMRYCVASEIRIDAAKAEVRPGMASDARQLKRLIADFKSRCGKYQSAGADFELAKSQVDGRRSDIEKQGRIDWYSTMQARLQAEEAAAATASSANAATLAPNQDPASAPAATPSATSVAPAGVQPVLPSPDPSAIRQPAPTPSRSGLPDNARLDFSGRSWVCNRGYTQLGSQCVEVQMPTNAQLDYSGHSWTCKRGFSAVNGACEVVSLPPNAQLDYTGHAWACMRGFVASAGGCIAVEMQPNAQLDYTGHAWTCMRGFVASGAACNPVQIPANAQLDYTGHAWACQRGFSMSGGGCSAVQIPLNAQLDYTGHAWTCIRGYRRAGDQCVPI